MNFNSKETYLAARAEWKADYAKLSQDIRDARRSFNKAASLFGKTPATEVKEYWEAVRALQTARVTRSNLTYEANKMLDELAKAKVEAARQWQESVHKKSQQSTVV